MPSCWAAPFELAPSFDRRALTELLQLEQLADLDLPFGLGLTTGLKREPLAQAMASSIDLTWRI
jgi:hypothetical protein